RSRPRPGHREPACAEVLLEHLGGDRRRRLTTGAAVLDEHHDGHLGVVGRGEAAEPTVRAGEIPAQALALSGEPLAVIARGDDLRRTRLARDDHAARDARVVCRAALTVHDPAHRLLHQLDEVFTELDLPRDLWCGLLDGLAVG